MRWRVMSALWTLAATTGLVPEAMFSLQIPAVDFAASAWLAEPAKRVPEVLTYYAPGRFLPTGDLQGATLDSNEVGRTTTIPASGFSDFAVSSPAEVPAWLRAIYAERARYRHVSTSIEEVPFNFEQLNLFLTTKLGRAPATEAYIEQQTLVDLFAGMSGMICEDLSGSTTPSTRAIWEDSEIVNVVSSIKTNAFVPQAASSPVVEFAGVYYGAHLRQLEPSGICSKVTSITDWVFHDGYYDRRDSGLLFKEEVGGGSSFSLPASGVLTGAGSALCQTAKLSHPVATVEDLFPTASELSPRRRARAFAGSTPPLTACSAAHQLVQALTLGCLAGDNRSASPSKAVEVTKPSDIPALSRWIAAAARDARSGLGKMYLEGVPRRVVSEVKRDGLGASSKKGAKGEKLLEAAAAFGNVTSAWTDVTDQLAQIGLAVEHASLEVNAASLAEDEALRTLAIRRMNAIARMAEGALAAIPSIKDATGFWKDNAKGVLELAAGTYELTATMELENIAEKQKDNRVAKAMVSLRSDVQGRATQLQKSLTSIRTAGGQILAATGAVERLENKARFEAAKGAAQDFYQTTAGEIVPIPVNTALRRQYDILGIRYKQALADAKYLAFLARRAIEQRIGVPLSTISTKVGVLEAPYLWADDVCHLQGIDYKKLVDKVGPDAGSDTGYVDELSKQYIGDYVAKLRNFVEYYNVEFPSHEGDDTAIFSLKDDLLSPPDVCLADATNLLRYSGRLDMLVGPSEAAPKADGRWQMHACPASASKCLKVASGSALYAPVAPPDAAVSGSVSWLYDVPSSSGADAGTATASAPSSGPGTLAGPPGMVSQRVHLASGFYLLSWWDQARTFDGKTTVSAAVPYRVAVYDQSFSLVEGDSKTPHIATESAPWSLRNALPVHIKTEGDYFVSFSASAASGALGSVAIANVQLEKSVEGGAPLAYVATLSSRSMVSGSCPHRSSSDLQKAFEWHCSTGGVCWYELTTPFLIDTGLLKTPTAAAASKLAKGNFNFRHITLSLNLVGTGVRSCETTPTADCFGSGFVDYSLAHDASRAGILDYSGDVRVFSFGTAEIEHAKSLAAERYITMPVGSADQALLAQSGIEKAELRGRPLDGVYRLRIWDSPALQWHRLEDVQVVMKYRYWSRIQREAK